MFRCENCGSGYSAQAASSWESCPRCLAKERINVPLGFELGWRGDRSVEMADAQPEGAFEDTGEETAETAAPN
jgi:hypothetical protein